MKKLDLAILLIFTTLIFSHQPSSQANVKEKSSTGNIKIAKIELSSLKLLDSVQKMSKAFDSTTDSSKRKLPILRSQQKNLSNQIKTIDTLLVRN